MRLAKSIMLRRSRRLTVKSVFSTALLLCSATLFAQDNSPYSRYGLGDQFPQSNIATRGMGSINAGYADPLSVNFNNPASYAAFQTILEKNSKKLEYGRVVLDVGGSLYNHTLVAPNTPQSFTSSDAQFNYVQVGVPLRKGWGMSFGIRQLSRISYKVNRYERIVDPSTGLGVDSALTQFSGNGGSFLPSIGTGFSIGGLSIGVNAGYLFGRKETSARRSFVNDSVYYYPADFTTNTSFGDLFFNGGIQYKISLQKSRYIRLGVSGNIKQTLNASQDQVRQTFTLGTAGDVVQIDSVSKLTDIKGEVIYPASYKAGFVVGNDEKGWLFGADYNKSQWNEFRLFGKSDSVQNNWQINAGGQFRPKPAENFFSNVSYRFGVFTGKDYIHVKEQLPVFGVSFGAGLPIISRSRLTANQFNMVNVGLEYIRRGNNDSPLKENLFRLSLGFSFTDLWFGKRKYD